jgi:5-methylcytosine-specific restriction enzyme A
VDFQGLFGRVLDEYPVASRERPIAEDALAQFIRHDLADGVRQIVDPYYIVRGSPGIAPHWAETPWVAIFDPAITDSAQRGFYVVYLFRGDGTGVYLVLGHAMDEARAELRAGYLDMLVQNSRLDATLLGPDLTEGLSVGPLRLDARKARSRGYECGSVVWRFYAHDELPDDVQGEADLARFLELYSELIDARELVNNTEAEDLPTGDLSGEEARKYRWHRRAERNQRLVQEAKQIHGFVCEVCKFDFEQRYGELGDQYIEAHHLVPFAQLAASPTSTILDPRTDFASVCANCHRMLHRQNPPLTVAELARRLRPPAR